ncbi:hypothetical protein GF342_00320 [Candidatus Woesearchaeota archaeon]|nr:hypothetical protein [Candidatus Woesearchaeota archaeon]
MIRVIPAVNATTMLALRKNISIAETLSPLIDVDICDGRFVARKTVSLTQLRGLTTKKLSIDYMGQHPARAFVRLPKNTYRFVFHVEVANDIDALIRRCKAHKIIASIGLNPETPVSSIAKYLGKGVQVHLLTVHPGKSGQELIPSVLQKVRKIKKIREDTRIGIDGGVNLKTAKLIKRYPLNYVSATSAIFGAKDPKNAFRELKKALN